MKSYIKVFIIGFLYIKKWIIKQAEEDNLGQLYLVSFFAIVLFVYPSNLIKENDLNQRSSYASGVIIKMTSGRNAKRIYKFYVGKKTYTGSESRGPLSKIGVGDSIIVKYEYTNPSNNELYCYFEYTLDRSKLPDTVFYRQPIDVQRQPLK